ncbi:MAG TPA: T9SS type B sorting domain-containing protein [Eudoraea sp.]|nr:T9SS type B sorting domain-containing protein [Eudoraea sp.]
MEHLEAMGINCRRKWLSVSLFVLACSLLVSYCRAQAPDCTVLNGPLDGAAGVEVTTTLRWKPVANATNYILTVGTVSGGSDVLDRWPVGPGLNYTPPSGLMANTTYYVTVTPNNNDGSAANCPEESFTTGEAGTIPGCVTLLSPLDGAYGVPPGAGMTWAPQPIAAGYVITAGTSPGGTDILDNEDVGNVTTYNLPADFPEFQQIYVRIIPYNADRESAMCSEANFRTRGESPPLCTEIIDPFDGGQFVSVTANITWIRDFSASGYLMTIWEKDLGGVKILDNVDVGTGTNFKPPNFMGNTLYFVRITPYNDLGAAVNCEPISFTTGAAPLPPECTSLTVPVNGAGNVALSSDLSWKPVTGATGYILNVGTLPGGTDLVDGADIISSNAYEFGSDLPENTRIYVTLTPYGNSGMAEACTEESFMTEGFDVMTEFVPIPKFFTPNNDGFNDEWLVPSNSESGFTVVLIFNKFGQLLKQLEPNAGWDGNFNGRPLASDSYWYRIDTSSGDSLVGFFVLKR